MKKKTMDHADLLVLTLLKERDMYGYQIISELDARSEHIFEMKEGTLYPVLHGLWKSGAVECYEAEATAGKKRKYYHITRKGREFLKEEEAAWARYAKGMEAVLNYAPSMG